MKKMREGLKMENIKKLSLNNLKRELKIHEHAYDIAVKRKERISNWLSPSVHVSDSSGNGILLLMMCILPLLIIIIVFPIIYLGEIVFPIITGLTSFCIFFIFIYFIYIIPIKRNKECRKLRFEIHERERNIKEEKQKEEIETINERIISLINGGERLLVSKNFYDALQKFDDAIEILITAQNKYEQKKTIIIPKKKNGWTKYESISKKDLYFDKNIHNILNSKVEIVKNKVNEEKSKEIKLNIEKGEILKDQGKFQDSLQEHLKAFNIADEMFSSDEKNKKIEDIKAKIDDIYSIRIDRLIEQGNQLKSQEFFDKAIRIFNSAFDLSHKIYNSMDKDEAQNKIKNCFDSLYSDMIKEKIKTGNQLRKDLQYDDPIKIFRESIKIAEKLYDSSKKNGKISKLKSLIHQTQIAKIKNTILNLGTKFGRLHIMEISEECGEDESLIISTVREMIEGSEIYAKYFESSKSVAFDQQTNIKEIDKLMEQYQQWEKEGISKK